MIDVTASAQGTVTLPHEVLDHLGMPSGGFVDVQTLPDARVSMEKARVQGIERLFGCLAGKTNKLATLKEIEEAIADGWAGKIRFDDEPDDM